MMQVFIEAVALNGPGLAGWEAARGVLGGDAPYVSGPTGIGPILLLPPAERRRAGAVVRLAVGVGLEALAMAERPAARMATVFSSSGGDGETIHQMLTVLTSSPRDTSPTRFHNSVHNAPSGYWAVATQSREPSTALCGFDDSFIAGLVEAAAQAVSEARPVTLIAYDMPYPEPLHAHRPIEGAFAVALVLLPWPEQARFGRFLIGEQNFADAVAPDRMDDAGLERLRAGNPAARCLPLLARVARGEAGRVLLGGAAGSTLVVEYARP